MLKNGLLLAALGFSITVPHAFAEAFKFGVMADTQWTTNDATNNPNTVALGIINQILPEFIEAQVKFVVQVGDLTDNGSTGGLDTWGVAAQTLYNNGIGFYPVRGNHEPSATAGNSFLSNFPQTRGLGSNVAGAVNHASPTSPVGLTGLTYSFDYGNTRFIAIDQFTRTSGTTPSTNSAALDQISWVAQRLDNKPVDSHGFVFAHKELIGQNHTDNLLGANPSNNPNERNMLIGAMAQNNARYFLGGHDHMHHRAIVKSPDGLFSVQNIIHSSDSYKFYTPKVPSKDQTYNNSNRQEMPIAQELNSIGYYIFTVDGPRLTVDHYASDNGCGGSLGAGKDCDLKATPSLSFAKRESYGYSLNGKEFIIQPGATFTSVADSSPVGTGWAGTRLAILGGTNTISTTLYDGRVAIQDVNTGWTSQSEVNNASTTQLKSDVLTLWGMENAIGSEEADTYVLSLNYANHSSGSLAIVGKPLNSGTWDKVANRNFGGNKKFVVGAWKAGYGLGTYGVDPVRRTAWAVVNRGGEFAVAQGLDGDLNNDGVIDSRDLALVNQNLNKEANVFPDADFDNDGKITVLDTRKLALICSLTNCAISQ
ncbi:metallophosphoesterase [Methylophilus aquaticus]|uniref:Metallophosphoesterase n=2 Tax=Methylophilus aquaticus TaxID=1971610 RepID=A0ABT9JVV8_9PROT|nr:metallophosphoesterase [Methylophilus aquaticus]